MEQVRQLLALGASITAQDEQGRTALLAAAHQNNLSVTDLLIVTVPNLVNNEEEIRKRA